jgi:hypothetical protein
MRMGINKKRRDPDSLGKRIELRGECKTENLTQRRMLACGELREECETAINLYHQRKHTTN